jgi:recyclin-1
VLLLPVTIVPRTVGAVGGAIGGAFRSGAPGNGDGQASSWNAMKAGAPNATRGRSNETATGYAKGKDLVGETVFSVGDEDENGQYYLCKAVTSITKVR